MLTIVKCINKIHFAYMPASSVRPTVRTTMYHSHSGCTLAMGGILWPVTCIMAIHMYYGHGAFTMATVHVLWPRCVYHGISDVVICTLACVRRADNYTSDHTFRRLVKAKMDVRSMCSIAFHAPPAFWTDPRDRITRR